VWSGGQSLTTLSSGADPTALEWDRRSEKLVRMQDAAHAPLLMCDNSFLPVETMASCERSISRHDGQLPSFAHHLNFRGERTHFGSGKEHYASAELMCNVHCFATWPGGDSTCDLAVHPIRPLLACGGASASGDSGGIVFFSYTTSRSEVSRSCRHILMCSCVLPGRQCAVDQAWKARVYSIQSQRQCLGDWVE
jgi:hypothetical protein